MEEQSKHGHRRRARDKYFGTGVDEMSMLSLVELILFYSVKRSDTKPLAKTITEYFGNDIRKMLSADVEELKSIDGVGEKSAELLAFFGEVVNRCHSRRAGNDDIFPDMLLLKGYAAKMYFSVEKPCIEALFFDTKFNLLSVGDSDYNYFEYEGTDAGSIVAKGELVNAAFAIVFIYRDAGTYMPSESEEKLIEEMYKLCRTAGIKLYDCVIADETGTLSVSGDIRTYESLE